jgi:hypothetical protein
MTLNTIRPKIVKSSDDHMEAGGKNITYVNKIIQLDILVNLCKIDLQFKKILYLTAY